jgi:predicted nucleotidyltransferase
MSLEAVTRVLDGAGVRYALIGALALAARGAARSTLDIDLLTADVRVLDRRFWAGVRGVDVRKGDYDDPLRGVIRVSGNEPVDIVVAKHKWQGDIVDRAKPVTVRGVVIPVAQTTDLILLKLFAGGYRDLNDVRQLLAVGPRGQLVADVSAALEELPQEMRERWAQVVE